MANAKYRAAAAALILMATSGAAGAQGYYPPYGSPPPPPPPAPRYADPYEAHLHRLHFDCDRGDRRACVRFGIEIGQHQDRWAGWRAQHPEWFWYER